MAYKETKNLNSFWLVNIDMRLMDQANTYYLKAQEIAEKLLKQSPNSVPVMSDLQKIRNQLAYSYMLGKQWSKAIEIAQKSVHIGNMLTY